MTECATSNIFFVKDKIVYTPSIDCGILNGIMRDKIISLLDNIKINVVESKITLKEALIFDEAFLTNSLMGIMAIKSLGDVDCTGKYTITNLINSKLKGIDKYD